MITAGEADAIAEEIVDVNAALGAFLRSGQLIGGVCTGRAGRHVRQGSAISAVMFIGADRVREKKSLKRVAARSAQDPVLFLRLHPFWPSRAFPAIATSPTMDWTIAAERIR